MQTFGTIEMLKSWLLTFTQTCWGWYQMFLCMWEPVLCWDFQHILVISWRIKPSFWIWCWVGNRSEPGVLCLVAVHPVVALPRNGANVWGTQSVLHRFQWRGHWTEVQWSCNGMEWKSRLWPGSSACLSYCAVYSSLILFYSLYFIRWHVIFFRWHVIFCTCQPLLYFVVISYILSYIVVQIQQGWKWEPGGSSVCDDSQGFVHAFLFVRRGQEDPASPVDSCWGLWVFGLAKPWPICLFARSCEARWCAGAMGLWKCPNRLRRLLEKWNCQYFFLMTVCFGIGWFADLLTTAVWEPSISWDDTLRMAPWTSSCVGQSLFSGNDCCVVSRSLEDLPNVWRKHSTVMHLKNSVKTYQDIVAVLLLMCEIDSLRQYLVSPFPTFLFDHVDGMYQSYLNWV